jgi:hypothetical protein
MSETLRGLCDSHFEEYFEEVALPQGGLGQTFKFNQAFNDLIFVMMTYKNHFAKHLAALAIL